LPWPERVPAHIRDGPGYKIVMTSWFRRAAGVPAMAVCVRPDTEPPEIVAANEVEPDRTWLRELALGDRASAPEAHGRSSSGSASSTEETNETRVTQIADRPGS